MPLHIETSDATLLKRFNSVALWSFFFILVCGGVLWIADWLNLSWLQATASVGIWIGMTVFFLSALLIGLSALILIFSQAGPKSGA